MKAEVICSYSVLNTIFANYLNKMIGTIVNTVAVLVGGLLGLVLNKKMPGRVTSIYFQAIGLFTLAIGATMAVSMEKILIIVSSLAIGSLLGEWWNLEKGAEQLSEYLKKRFKIGSERFSEGLVTAFLCFLGSMTILGTIQEGTGGSPDLLYTKSMMDFSLQYSGFCIWSRCSIFCSATFFISGIIDAICHVCIPFFH